MQGVRRQRARAVRMAVEALEGRRLYAFGLTTSTSAYTVDTGAGVVFSVLRGGTISSTVHLGDLTSVKYNGVETLAPYSATSRYSHYEQGLGSIAVISATVDPAGQWIKITCDDSAETSGGVIQYYVAKKGDPNIYMASLPTDVNNGPGEGRFIAYMNKSVFTNIEDPSDISANIGAVEGSDVFKNADGTTHSKFYNDGREMIDNLVHGITGTGIGAYMYMGNREHSAGGPFFKDIDFQTTSAATEMYNCVFTGHTQTEAYRQGLQGPYAMQLTNGSAPVTPDYSFLEGVGISGLIPASARGTLSGTASGVQVGHGMVVGLSNTTAQYWTRAFPGSSGYVISGVQPGTYTETLYDNEIAVGTRTVTLTAGQTTVADITNTYYTPTATWRIGTWDGTPAGFLNADKISIMHPSDVRMSDWNTVTNFVIGTNTDSQWPLAQFMDVNNSQRITFTLTSAQAAVAQTMRIGITEGFAGGRNRITVNTGQTYAWTSAIPAASIDLNSRGITRGTWRGDNQVYTYSIPTSALKAGVNTIDLPVVSGSYVAGQGFLSPNVAYDAIDLVPTASVTAPTVASITVAPTTSISVSASQTFTAVAKSSSGATLPANIVWTATRGTINDAGQYIAPATIGTDTITATYGTVTKSATINIVSNSPAPTVTAMQIDDGTAQRSMIRSITLTFDQPVTFDASDLTLLLNGAATGTTLVVTPSSSTQYVVSFSGSGVATAGSLADGRYQLSLKGSLIKNAAGVAMATSPNYSFTRLYGDIDGDVAVTFSDFLQFQAAFGSTTGQAGFLSGFDSDGNGVINFSDFLVLQTNFGKII